MRKVPPSVMVREQIDQPLFSEGLDANGETILLSSLAQLGLSYLVQQALEQKQKDFLDRGYDSRLSRERFEELGLGWESGRARGTTPTRSSFGARSGWGG
jgi:hypothetical protein